MKNDEQNKTNTRTHTHTHTHTPYIVKSTHVHCSYPNVYFGFRLQQVYFFWGYSLCFTTNNTV